MKRLYFQIICGLLGLLALILLPYPGPGQIGAYNPISRLYVCADHNTCVHEQGHRLDQELSYPSQSAEFEKAVTKYIVVQFSGIPSDHAIHVMNILLTRMDKYREAYANIWMWADGNIDNVPAEFREFYRVK